MAGSGLSEGEHATLRAGNRVSELSVWQQRFGLWYRKPRQSLRRKEWIRGYKEVGFLKEVEELVSSGVTLSRGF
ncbi:unnamed protein product [Urochloa humidicola]